ncbi:MAG: acetyl-CoA carboxylase carboxyl transferase subunit beta [Acidobacteria bacterium]|nr:acetyl-CoA carboxylase carboxyl transferase subunit beta [Acidobacteriota bacterium]
MSSTRCSKCNREIDESVWRQNEKVCPFCDWHFPLTARERIALLTDAGKFWEFDKRLSAADPLHFEVGGRYRERLREAERRTGSPEAATTGEALLEGRRVVLVCIDFEFMGGTMGSAVGEKVVRAFDRAMRKRLPVITVLASGGARVQEGMLALMQMAKTTGAVARHKHEGLLFISVLTNPSFGGTMASFASLGDVLIAEPGAEIGFAGARVVEGTIAEKIPQEARRAETLLEHGLIDLVVHRLKLKSRLSLLLAFLRRNSSVKLPAVRPRSPVQRSASPAEVLGLARHPQRPRARDYIERLFTEFLELHGDRSYRDDPAVIGGLAAFHGLPVLVVAQQGGAMPFPEGYRKAQRLLRLASKFRLTVISFVDTPGAHPGLEAEYRGIPMAIAESLAILSTLEVPILNIVIGEGGSGGALALGIADVILMQENAIYSVISPEGAAAILHQDPARSPEIVSALKLQAQDLLELGVIDDIVAEPAGGAHLDPGGAADALAERMLYHLRHISEFKPKKLVAQRLERFRSIGKFEKGWMRIVRNMLDRLRHPLANPTLPRARS